MITLASDFGEPYPAAMRGVLLRNGNPRLVDVSHDLPRGDVRGAAFWLRFLLPEFPPAVHLAVVDPGVGTDREAIVVRAGEHVLVGPDNGSLLPAARALAAGRRAGEGPAANEGGAPSANTQPNAPVSQVDTFRINVEAITERADIDTPASQTFHGRDVFAPAAGIVHEVGVDELEATPILSPVDGIVDLTLPRAQVEGNVAVGEVLVVDGFGNVITNVPGSFLAPGESVRVNGRQVPICTTFASVDPGCRLATVGSHGYVECDVNDGRGDDAFGLSPGDEIRLHLES